MKTIALNLIAGLEGAAQGLGAAGSSLSEVLGPAEVHWMHHVPCCSCLLRDPRWDDLVLLWTREGWRVKRVVGIPGDELAAKDGSVQVNGHLVVEPCLVSPDPWALRPGHLHQSHCVVLGENHHLPPFRVEGLSSV